MSDVEPADGPVNEVCVVGAGIAGLNALVVASTYLGRGDQVLLADSRSRVGGMWVDTYDYVRLHQPHGNFTAGNIKWTLGREPSYLAAKPEVLSHFQHCLETVAKRVDLKTGFGWEYLSHTETRDLVEVRFRLPDGSTRTERAKRLIKAFGHDVTPSSPLLTTSSRVRSTTPEQLDVGGAEVRADDAPFWIIGGGKTAMDTTHQLLTALPGREVHVLAGPGTVFSRRDTFFPTGARRWWAGTPINTMLRQVGRRFDGTNEVEVHAWFRSTYGVSPTAEATDFFGAYLSDAEVDLITSGARSIELEYFTDAVDRGDGVDLVLRSGATRSVPEGSWLLNCTGSLLRKQHDYEPFVSPSGRVLAIQMRSSATGVFSSFAGYYLTHLLFREKLAGAGLYAVDIEGLHQKAKPVVTYASMSLALHNLSLIADALPTKVLLDCGLDYDLWYPLPRRMIGVAESLRTHRGERAHHRRTLDTLGERYDVQVGVLDNA